MNRWFFEHNCNKCQGLCCLATTRDGGEFAAHDPVGKPCQHLMWNFRCRIHEKLEKKWFPGCMTYRCYSVWNRLTRILRVAGITDIRKPGNERQKEVSRVVMQIFKDLEWVLALLEWIGNEWELETFEALKKDVEDFFQKMEKAVREGGNLYACIPEAVSLQTRVRIEKLEWAKKSGALLALSMFQQNNAQKKALQFLTDFSCSEIPQREFDRLIHSEVGEIISQPEEFRKYLFAAYQFGWSYYRFSKIWSEVSMEAMIILSDTAAKIYSEYRDSKEGLHVIDIMKVVFEKCSKMEIREI